MRGRKSYGKNVTRSDVEESVGDVVTLTVTRSARGNLPSGTILRGETRHTKPKTFEADRFCGECDTKLSVYNSGPNCYRHTEAKPWRVRGRLAS